MVETFVKCAKCGKEIKDTYVKFEAQAVSFSGGITAEGAALNIRQRLRAADGKEKAYCMDCAKEIESDVLA